MPGAALFAGERHVERFVAEFFLHGGLGERGPAALEAQLELGAHAVGELTHDGPLLRRELAHLLEDGGELALFAEVLHAQLLQGLCACGLGYGGGGELSELFQHLFHYF